MGLLLGDSGSSNVSVHHNLFSHIWYRNPRVKLSGVSDIVNNVIYDYGDVGSRGPAHISDTNMSNMPINIVGNYMKKGPSSGDIGHYVSTAGDVALYVEGNRTPGRPNDTLDEKWAVHKDGWGEIVTTRHATPPVTETTAEQAYIDVLAGAGTSFPMRDAVDDRIVKNVEDGTGRIIDALTEIPGVNNFDDAYPFLAAGVAPPDNDHDGMADDWETDRGLDADNANDRNDDRDGDGYTNLEEYLHWLTIQDVPDNGNQRPLAANDGATTDEDTSIRISVLSNDSDPDGDSLSILGWTQGSQGSVTSAGAGRLTYSPNANVFGSDTFSYTIADGRGGTDTANVTVDINPINDSPIAVVDFAATSPDSSVRIDVLANDIDVDGDSLRIDSVQDGNLGSTTIIGGQVEYSPDPGRTGNDTFTYTVNDGNGESDTATVTVNVTSSTSRCGGTGDVCFAVIGDYGDGGNSLVFFVNGTGTRFADSYDGDPDTSPLLHVRYEVRPIVTSEDSLEVRIDKGTDDAEQSAFGMSLSSDNLELGNQSVGMLFNGIQIPDGAVIQDTYIQFHVNQTSSSTSTLTVLGQDIDNATTFTFTPTNISARAKTSASVAWSPPAWTTVGADGPNQRTPNIAAIAQEIVDRPGWSSGNSLVFFVTGTGTRFAESYDGNPSAAPLLHITYTYEVEAVSDNSTLAAAGRPLMAILDTSSSDADVDGEHSSTSVASDGTIEFEHSTSTADFLETEVELPENSNLFPHHNASIPFDTNDDGCVSPVDALLVINKINRPDPPSDTSHALVSQIEQRDDSRTVSPHLYWDVNGDGFLSAVDVLGVINWLNANSNSQSADSRSLHNGSNQTKDGGLLEEISMSPAQSVRQDASLKDRAAGRATRLDTSSVELTVANTPDLLTVEPSDLESMAVEIASHLRTDSHGHATNDRGLEEVLASFELEQVLEQL